MIKKVNAVAVLEPQLDRDLTADIETGSARKKYRWQINKSKFLSDTEYDQLRKNVYQSRSKSAMLVKLYMFTAARAHEGLAVRQRDLCKESKTVFIKGLKGSNDREVPLPPWYFYQLWHFAKRICDSPENRIFQVEYSQMNRYWHLYRPVNKTIHSLRHTLAIKVYKGTKDIKLVQTLLGHTSIKNTMVYLDYVYSQNEMRRILKVKY